MRSDRKAAALSALRELEAVCVYAWAWTALKFVRAVVSEEHGEVAQRIADCACPECGFSVKHHRYFGGTMPNGEWCSVSDSEIYRTYMEIEHAECERLRSTERIDHSLIVALRKQRERLATENARLLMLNPNGFQIVPLKGTHIQPGETQ